MRKVGSAKDRPRMVDWYNPIKLANTGMRTLLSTTLGSMIDTRRIQAAEGPSHEAIVDYDPDGNGESFSFDYMADTGDGFDSTYTLAYLLTRPWIELAGRRSQRGDALILGGDEVYPVASKKNYQQRLSWPFHLAADNVRAEPEFERLPRTDLFFVPGNHDWYDSLGSFTNSFLAYRVGERLLERELGQFKIRQVRSYFILKLPHDWQVWALDIQLGEDIDRQQYAFFSENAETIEPRTKIILCSAEPCVVSGAEKTGSGLQFSINRITRLAYDKGAKVLVQLAGDVHNYQRYELEASTRRPTQQNAGAVETYTRHHIVSGGGGAFLHPTHGFNKGSKKSPRIDPRERYPSKESSRRLSRRVLGFAFSHKSMALLIGTLYACFFWSGGLESFSASYLLEQPGSTLLLLAVLVGCVLFAGWNRLFTFIWGALHGAAHLAAAVASWRAAGLAAPVLAGSSPVAETYLTRGLVLLIGALLGGTLFGLYLYVSLNWFRLHHNETFSALSYPHYKNFLRCRINPDGSLTISVIGVEKTASPEERHPAASHLVEEFTIAAEGPLTPQAERTQVLK